MSGADESDQFGAANFFPLAHSWTRLARESGQLNHYPEDLVAHLCRMPRAPPLCC